MRKKQKYTVLTFSAVTEAMAMEKYCIRNQIPGRFIPLPGEISAGCGLAWRIGCEEFLLFREKLEASGIAWEQAVELFLS